MTFISLLPLSLASFPSVFALFLHHSSLHLHHSAVHPNTPLIACLHQFINACLSHYSISSHITTCQKHKLPFLPQHSILLFLLPFLPNTITKINLPSLVRPA
ncbi:hypothetical protein O6H91_Y328300 [Diphasiastrum complanatum]|nr:hypothetical protein O6H91_Y328300 [Diphasiastrum complanatum]